MIRTVRNWVAALLTEWPTYRRLIAAGGGSYLALRNRRERLRTSSDNKGYLCEWQWTSDLYAPKVFPSLGLRLIRRACSDHPIVRTSAPLGPEATPLVTFMIGHRGASRIPHLLATIESIASQQSVSVECLVIEQDTEPQVQGKLPAWVRHVHTPPPAPEMPYCRAWTFNAGAQHARGRILVLHDNDMLVPTDYAQCLLSHFDAGYETVNLKRFIFYLTEAHTAKVLAGCSDITDEAPLAITQNLEAGGSIAITREAYDRIGGMDESFIGWGGEDNEFWERAQTLRVWPYAYLPLVHLWHPAQPGKHQADNPTLAHYRQLSAIAPQERIRRLRETPSGQLSGPAGWAPPPP